MKKSAVFNVVYDRENDMLYLHSKNGKAKESVEVVEDIVLDIDKNNNLVGIEFFYASEFFKALDRVINENVLENLKNVKIRINHYRNYIIISLDLEFNGKLIKEKLPPLSLREYESPLVSSIA